MYHKISVIMPQAICQVQLYPLIKFTPDYLLHSMNL